RCQRQAVVPASGNLSDRPDLPGQRDQSRRRGSSRGAVVGRGSQLPVLVVAERVELAARGEREAVGLAGSHLRDDAALPWQGHERRRRIRSGGALFGRVSKLPVLVAAEGVELPARRQGQTET